jgi:hypothetical protein
LGDPKKAAGGQTIFILANPKSLKQSGLRGVALAKLERADQDEGYE